MKRFKGYLIALEGSEGGGKTTQIQFLADRLKALKKPFITLREPGGTPIADQIREVVLSSKNGDMQDTTEVLLFQAARAQLYGEIIIPALKAGKIVLMDRTRDSSLVYQGMVRGFGKELIEQLNDIATQKLVPDLTILLDVSVETGLGRRMASGKMDRIDLQSKDFHQQVRDAYLQVARENKGDRWLIVDGEESIEEVSQAIWKKVEEKLGL